MPQNGSLGERDRASVVDSDGLLLVLGGGSLIDDEDTTSNCGQSTPLCILALLEATAKMYCNEQLYNAQSSDDVLQLRAINSTLHPGSARSYRQDVL
eukprot:CAMPEP_0172435390 /NCGR_PEP_ID=MMETSP1064-20121228/71153_1 /TAXON_ID=202472 /ORGANISM="Aulacoseira subarctica , Strain CCAP 1002/5" /LENGTH=96 /DNA_ID=CAMNT_0013183699 /DNA_START=179 /DNA_END=470 /DNA_ORIENTATION=+